MKACACTSVPACACLCLRVFPIYSWLQFPVQNSQLAAKERSTANKHQQQLLRQQQPLLLQLAAPVVARFMTAGQLLLAPRWRCLAKLRFLLITSIAHPGRATDSLYCACSCLSLSLFPSLCLCSSPLSTLLPWLCLFVVSGE